MEKYFVSTKSSGFAVFIERTYGASECLNFNSTEELNVFLNGKHRLTKVIFK